VAEVGKGRGGSRLRETGGPSDLSELLGPDAEDAAGELAKVVRTVLGRLSLRYGFVQEQFDDLVQQVLLKCLEHARRIQERSAAPLRNRDAWLVRVTHNTVLSAGRARGHRRDDCGWPEGFEPPAPRPISPEDRLTVRRALAALDEACRRLLILRDVLGEARAAIAERLEISANALGVRLHRCRRKLLDLVQAGSPA